MDKLSNILKSDANGMSTYEYIVNNIDTCVEDMPRLVENLRRVDTTGQFFSSSARFLNATDPEMFAEWIPVLIDGAIDKDRERRYIGSLLKSIWGEDYVERAAEISETDDNFRRIFKRIYPLEVNSDLQNII